MEKQPLPAHTEAHMQSIVMWDPTPLGRYAYKQLQNAAVLEKQASELERQLHEDPLTGIPNRRAINPYFDKEIARLNRQNTDYGTELGMQLLLLDLNGFKAVNDTLGHTSGDDLLKSTADNLSKTLREYDLVCRFGGDEFVMVLTELKDSEDTTERIKDIRKSVSCQVPSADGSCLGVSTAIGVAAITSQDVDRLAKMTENDRREEIATRILEADDNMYSDKRKIKTPASLPATFDANLTPDQSIEQQMTEISSQGSTVK